MKWKNNEKKISIAKLLLGIQSVRYSLEETIKTVCCQNLCKTRVSIVTLENVLFAFPPQWV